MDHDAVANIEADVVGFTAAKAPVENEVAGFELVKRDLRNGGQIGRASCRERV